MSMTLPGACATSASNATAVTKRPLRVCMLAYTFYENDGRVMRYAEALAQDGSQVDAIVLRRPGQAAHDTLRGVRVMRIQQREKNEKGKLRYLLRILRFFVHSSWEVTRQHWKQPYDLIHVHSVPDFEVFAALVPKLTGAKVILDIHDIVPEFYAAKFGVGEESLAYRVLKVVERWSTGFADYVIAANDLWLHKLTSRAIPPHKCSAFINYPDTSVFREDLRRRGEDGRFLVLYPGTLNWHQGLDIAVKAMAIATREAPDMELHIYGEGPSKGEIGALIVQLGLSRHVQLHPPRTQHEIAAVMADADLGVVPKRNDAFGGDAFSTKILEFMALGVPVVAAATRVDRHYFDDSLIQFFEPDDPQSLAQALLAARSETQRNAQRAAHALRHARVNSWGERRHAYLQLVRGLVHAGT
jgi:glycosyltransferase involved in cell wall biosynthesis